MKILSVLAILALLNLAVALIYKAPSPPYANHTRPPYTNRTHQINSLAVFPKTMEIVSTRLVIGTTSDFVTYCPEATTLTVTKCDQGKCSRTHVTVSEQETVSLSGSYILTLEAITTHSLIADESTANPTTFKTLTISRPTPSWIINPLVGPPFRNTSSRSLPKTTVELSSTVAASPQPQPLSGSSTMDDTPCSSSFR